MAPQTGKPLTVIVASGFQVSPLVSPAGGPYVAIPPSELTVPKAPLSVHEEPGENKRATFLTFQGFIERE